MFGPIGKSLIEWSRDPEKKQLSVSGLSAQQWLFCLDQLFETTTEIKELCHTIILPSISEAEEFHEACKQNIKKLEVLYFPSQELSPYSGALSQDRDLFKRFYALDKISCSQKPRVIVAPVQALSLRLPLSDFFIENRIKISVSDIIPPRELAQKLGQLGYLPSTSIEEPGQFSQKGEVFDVYPISHTPVRIHYFDDMIEEIHAIDTNTQRSLPNLSFDHFDLGPCPNILTHKNFVNHLRKNIPRPPLHLKNLCEEREELFTTLQNGQLFAGYPPYLPLFFSENNHLLKYINDHSSSSLIHFVNAHECDHNFYDFIDSINNEYEEIRSSHHSLMAPPEKLFYSDFNEFKKKKHISVNAIYLEEHNPLHQHLDLDIEETKKWLARSVKQTLEKREYVKACLQKIIDALTHKGKLLICYQLDSTKSEIENILNFLDVSSSVRDRIVYLNKKLDSGFFYKTENLVLLSDQDLFTYKKRKTKNTTVRNEDLFAEQLSSLKENDFVIHRDYGIGKFLGLKPMDDNLNSPDFLIIEYTHGDKIYVPVYKMNLIQKHSDSSSPAKIENLRKNKFNLVKSRAKDSVKKLAFDILKLNAKRESGRAFSFSPPDDLFHDFEMEFPFQETPDQLKAIDNVLHDMQLPKPMDHLVCGDVGFGKTEIAMRAAFKAVLDKKQVAVLSPTTILTLQHFHSFKKRFQKFPVEIEFISRFKTTKEVRDIKERLKEGNLDIIIGTHKLLSKDVVFADLGLVIVDEEQRFGVAHKEKLKLLKSNVDFLTLTATPIPRTLQLSFLGLKDLSLIKTPPPRRQSIKTYITKSDPHTIQQAIQKEIARGGQVFVVHNKVKDIEEYSHKIRELVPKAKLVFAHGQLPEKELEKRVTDFFLGKYQILVSTTIIESGIDIPNANTLIVDRADSFGLAQLHQLRGRIGRSEKKAYAYFTIPHKKVISEIATKRLQALQTYAEMGSGFNIATSDLEIRGAGDILGAEQSGHIEAIGLELYMELLNECIAEIKGEEKINIIDIEVKTPFQSYIPNSYIKDQSSRLKYYKKLSNSQTQDELKRFIEDIEDIYGPLPPPVIALNEILKVRLEFRPFYVRSIAVINNRIILEFDSQSLNHNSQFRDRLVSFFLSRPKKFRFFPEFKVEVLCNDNLSIDNIFATSKDVAQQIQSC